LTGNAAAALKTLDADVEQALESVNVPSYVLDSTGIVRWLNASARRLVGDCRGRHFTSLVAAEDRRRAQEIFAQKVVGTKIATDASGVILGRDGERFDCQVSAVRLTRGGHVVGVFGQLPTSEPETQSHAPHPHLTPRQAEVLRLLERGHSTAQIAGELHLSQETVRNHVRHLLRALGVNSRLEAVAVAHRLHGEQPRAQPASVS
jgi:PAS domain S-box-containing protein